MLCVRETQFFNKRPEMVRVWSIAPKDCTFTAAACSQLPSVGCKTMNRAGVTAWQHTRKFYFFDCVFISTVSWFMRLQMIRWMCSVVAPPHRDQTWKNVAPCVFFWRGSAWWFFFLWICVKGQWWFCSGGTDPSNAAVFWHIETEWRPVDSTTDKILLGRGDILDSRNILVRHKVNIQGSFCATFSRILVLVYFLSPKWKKSILVCFSSESDTVLHFMNTCFICFLFLSVAVPTVCLNKLRWGCTKVTWSPSRPGLSPNVPKSAPSCSRTFCSHSPSSVSDIKLLCVFFLSPLTEELLKIKAC